MPEDRDPGPNDDLEREPHPVESAPRRRRGGLVAAAVVVATILTAGALEFTADRPPAAQVASVTTPVIVPPGGAELIVREGDPVEASGPVEDGRLCSPAPVPAGLPGDPCAYGVEVPGVRPAGAVTLRGRWHPNRLSDIERLPYAPTSAGFLGHSGLPDTPPCPAPAGGWRDGEDYSDGQVRDYLRAHADEFAEPFATHAGNARILVVEVVKGDVDRARTALTALYTDNLCVVAAPGKPSIADVDHLQATTGKAIGALMDDTASGIYTTVVEDGRIRVHMVQLTQPLYDKLTTIGLDHLILDPWMRPTRA